MAFYIKKDALSAQEFVLLKEKTKLSLKTTIYNPDVKTISCYRETIDRIYFPLGMWSDVYNAFPNKNNIKNNFWFTKTLLTKETDLLGRDQDVLAKQALVKLSSLHSVFISAFTGYGKTTLGIYLFTKLQHKTVIICHLDVVKKQWYDAIKSCTNCSVLLGSCKPEEIVNYDVFIVGIQKSAKRTPFIEELSKVIGTVILDESHIATMTAFTQSLLQFTPMYLVGLSATPDRADGLHKLFRHFFGPENNFLHRVTKKELRIVKYKTKYVPEVQYTVFRGKYIVDWKHVIKTLSENEKRNQEVVALAREHTKEKIVIFCERNNQALYIYEILKKTEDVELLIGTTKKWRKEARILVAGIKKGGVGMDDESLTMIILASDVKDVRQLEGRLRINTGLIYDIVDDYRTLENHWKIREKWYRIRGATISERGL